MFYVQAARGQTVDPTLEIDWDDDDGWFLEHVNSVDLEALKANPYHDRVGRFTTARAFSGSPVSTTNTLSKAETGALGEQIAARHLGPTAMAVNVTQTMRSCCIRAITRGSAPRCSPSIIIVEAAPGDSPHIADWPGSHPRRVNTTAMTLAAAMLKTFTANTTAQ